MKSLVGTFLLLTGILIQPATAAADTGEKNTDAGEFDAGYGLGGKLGKASKPGSWEIGYEYRDLEADAVVAVFADSDFAGGGTDGSGHIFKGGYAFTDSWVFKLTYF